MKRIIITVLAIVAIAAAAGAIFLFSGPSNPTIEGKKLSAWLNEIADRKIEVRDHAKEVLRKNADQAGPALLAWMSAHDSPERQRLAAVVGVEYETANGRHLAAGRGIAAIGAGAKSLTPDLIRLLSDEDITRDAMAALSAIGPEAVPALIEAMSSANVLTRRGAAGAVGPSKQKAAAAVDPLIRLLKDNDAEVRFYSAQSLGQIGLEPGKVIPLLITELDDKDLMVVTAAANALADFKGLAKDALPRLKQIAKTKDQASSSAAKGAIESIALGADVNADSGKK